MSMQLILISLFSMAFLYGLLFSYFEDKFSREWFSLIGGVLFTIVNFFIIPQNVELATKEFFLGGLLNIPFKLNVNFHVVALGTFAFVMGNWCLSRYKLPKSVKATIYPLLNILVLMAFLINDLFVKIIIFEIMISLNSISHFLKTYNRDKKFTMILNSFCLGFTLLMLVLDLTESIEVYRHIFNGTFFLYIVFRSGLLREFAIQPVENKENAAGIVEQYFSSIVLISVLHGFLNGPGWGDLYFQNFAFIFLVAYATILYFILNRTETSHLLRISQVKYLFLLLAVVNSSTSPEGLLPFVQLLVFFFVWEIFSERKEYGSIIEKLKWLIIVLLVGPIPILPFQNALISNVKKIYETDVINGAVASVAVLIVLSLIPAGMFKNDEEALS